MLRHWYATTLWARGVPLIVMSRPMGHDDVATTLRTYAHCDDGKAIREALG
jgi:integrase